MSVHATTSPRYSHPPPSSHSSRPPATPSARGPSSVAKNMPPLLSPQIARTPFQQVQQNDVGRTPSPNYFGFHVSESSYPSDEQQHHTRQNWSPPSSTVRSTAAFTPSVVPVDQNPEFAAFRRQSEGVGRTFSLSSLHDYSSSPAAIDDKQRTPILQSPIKTTEARAMAPPPRFSMANSLDPDAANLGRSPKRHLSSEAGSLPAPAIRKSSPANATSGEQENGSSTGSPDRHPRMSAPPLKLPSMMSNKVRAETLPAGNTESMLVTPAHVVNLLESAPESILILDLRVSTLYARSRVSGSLNLCIPTTLIKRPSFNVQKLAETFKVDAQRKRFENWRSSQYIVVYDQAASQMKDAQICLNTIQKFEKEGYEGTSYIVKGGFAEFARCFPKYVNKGPTMPGSSTGPPRLSLPGAGESDGIPPVIGGCPMPATKNAANPFFGNIRQNMDLIGGVGQIPIKYPQMVKAEIDELPKWLRTAAEPEDAGARVSDKFLHIEKREQKRMQDALSGSVSYGNEPSDAAGSVQIAGIEKGSKNRYNNIWPFEHTRVKLQDVPNHGCDYVNANHVKSALSNKQYIATQGPIPATFSDFWNMVWQQDVRVIVMLTAEKEGGQVKAHDYWSGKNHGPFTLDLLSERKASVDPIKIYKHRHRPSTGGRKQSENLDKTLDNLTKVDTKNGDEPYVIVRKLTLSHSGFPFERMREITQLQYSSWPDFGAPAHPAHLLGLVEQCDAVVRSTIGTRSLEPDPPETRPVLVHCSAGCGRTGTFCTVDSVIDMLKRQRFARRNRQGTPMDVDSAKGQDDSPFFANPSAFASDTMGAMADGRWIDREDQDLVERTVEDFRHQRLSMVQSLRQFVLCYESVLEWLQEQNRLAKQQQQQQQQQE